MSRQIPKRDKFGIWLKIENSCLDLQELIITASLESKVSKAPTLSAARIKVELLKRLIRTAHELKIIEVKKYLELESELQESSKMLNGWLKFIIINR